MRIKTLFRFSSYEHRGCRISCRGGFEVKHIVVEAVQEEIAVHEVGVREIVTRETSVKGGTQISGIMYGCTDASALDDKRFSPFDVKVHAYSPIEDVDYVLGIRHCYVSRREITPSNDIHFVAAYIRPWYDAKVGSTVCIPEQTMRPITTCTNDHVNQNGDPFDVEQNPTICNDTAHIGPWTTVRACIDCGVLISGGPTRCLFCAEKQGK